MNVIFDIEKNMKKFFTSVQNVLGMNKIKEIYFETQATMGLSEILLCHEKKKLSYFDVMKSRPPF